MVRGEIWVRILVKGSEGVRKAACHVASPFTPSSTLVVPSICHLVSVCLHLFSLLSSSYPFSSSSPRPFPVCVGEVSFCFIPHHLVLLLPCLLHTLLIYPSNDTFFSLKTIEMGDSSKKRLRVEESTTSSVVGDVLQETLQDLQSIKHLIQELKHGKALPGNPLLVYILHILTQDYT